MSSPPPTQNEAGFCQATKSVSGITTILFPPFACCGKPSIPTPGGSISPGNLLTCELLLDGRLLMSYPRQEATVAYTFYPHAVVRETTVQGIEFSTQTFMPPRERAVAELITIRNVSDSARRITLGFDLRAGVTCKRGPWYVGDPAEADNRITPDLARGYLVPVASTHQRSGPGIAPPAVPHRTGPHPDVPGDKAASRRTAHISLRQRHWR